MVHRRARLDFTASRIAHCGIEGCELVARRGLAGGCGRSFGLGELQRFGQGGCFSREGLELSLQVGPFARQIG